MLEGLMSMNQHHQQQLMEESLSNLTSEASNSSINPSSLHQQQNPSSNKKKRSLPGNPDPDAEVIALSPKSLLAKNRFLCEICNKGFQRDQNLQLHRRGHNLPWKLKQRSKTEVVRKKVYVCPETSCVHHDPSRALGDLTGIKKHFCRKHGEKKWKCDKCSKKYAVQSDWKAHSKICGTREYKCDCGTLFSRRDSFITHRAFCDVLAEEAARTTASNPLLLPPPPQLQQLHPHHQPGSQIYSLDQNPEIFSIKQEIQNSSFNLIPPWMMHQSSQQIQNPSNVLGGVDGGGGGPTGYFPTVSGSHFSSSLLSPQAPQMSATALLQKAAQIGATISTKIAEAAEQDDDPLQFPSATSSSHRAPPDHVHSTTAGFGLNLSSHDHQQQEQEDMNSNINGFFNNGGFRIGFSSSSSSSSLLNDVMMNSLSNAFSVDNNNPFGNTNNNDGLTKDFLGLRPLSTSDILSFAGFSNSINNAAPSSSSATHHQQDLQNKTWQG